VTTARTNEVDVYVAALKLRDALKEALPACPIHGDHPAHMYWLGVSDRGYAALSEFKRAVEGGLGADSRG
jgi:hypothetical protein